jgi:probable F420-dependent oxidoreductase
MRRVGGRAEGWDRPVSRHCFTQEAEVKLGLGLPQRQGVDLRVDITEVARTAEAAGYASLWVYERLLFPVETEQGMYGVPGLAWSKNYQECADPLAVLAVAAAVTTSVRLGTSVLVAPLHAPAQLAKSLATIDQISGGGRLIAGLGSGWSVDEMAAVGVELKERGVLLDETLDVLEAAWGQDPVSCRGSRTSIHKALLRPKPVAGIPVMLGGGASKAALDRIARRAQGWLPTGIPIPAAGSVWRMIREKAEGYGRETHAMEMIYRANVILTDGKAREDRYPFVGDMDQVVDDIVACADAGADEVLIDLQPQDEYPGTKKLLETALEIHERATAAGI